MTSNERAQVEEITRGQSSNVEWHRQRMGSITSTSMNRIHRFTTQDTKIKASSLIKTSLPPQRKITSVPKMPRKDCLKWGKTHEPEAIKRYMSVMGKVHKNFEIVQTGLVVHPQIPYIRASPDGIGFCDCHPPRLIEVKCPYTGRKLPVKDAVEKGEIIFLTYENSRFVLRDTTSNGYLSQVQSGMAITETKVCDFIVYNVVAKSMVIVGVKFDMAFWDGLLKSAQIFFSHHLAPAIMGRSPVNVKQEDSSDSEQECDRVEVKSEVDSGNAQCSTDNTDCPTYCQKCKRLLPEEAYIADDHSNASICCDHCDKWYCWPCARYTPDMEDIEYYCVPCVRSGEIEY